MNYFIDIMDFKEEIAAGYDYSDIVTDGSICTRLRFAKQKTGYGIKNFFVCPECGTRHTKLYINKDRYICRHCYPKNVYRIIQNTSKGSYKYIAYRMRRYAEAHGIELKPGPFNYIYYEKPARRKVNYWTDKLMVLQALENMRYQAIAYKKKWNLKTINSVLKWNNTFMYLFDLGEIQFNSIHWEFGVDMNTDW